MKQDPKAQIPGIDLTFADGTNGRIWGVSGLNDLRGESFEKAARYLEQRARQDGAFEWIITIDLDQVISSAATPLLALMKTLNTIVAQKPDRRSIMVNWRVKAANDSMQSLEDDIKDQFRLRNGNCLSINVLKHRNLLRKGAE